MALAGGKGEAVALGVSTVLNLDNFDGVDVSEYSRCIHSLSVTPSLPSFSPSLQYVRV